MNYLEKLEPIMKMAGELCLSLRDEALKIEYKEDGTPVTNADYAVSDFLIAALLAAFPGDAFVSEENHGLSSLKAERVWLIDPIDGTKHYIAGKDNFCIMLCLMQKAPVFSAIYYPVHGTLYFAERGKGSHRMMDGKEEVITLRQPGAEPRIVHGAHAALEIGEKGSGGTAKHLLMIARGELDCFLQDEAARSYWDTFPPALILTEAGGAIVDYEGRPLVFDTSRLFQKGFVAGHPSVVQRVVAMLKQR